MGLTAEIAKSVGVNVRINGSEELISAKDMETFLDETEDRKQRILGIEGFMCDGENRVPDMSAIADLSNLNTSSASIAEARRFLRSLGGGERFFEITFE